MKKQTNTIETKLDLAKVAKKATNEANKVKRAEELATLNNVKTNATNELKKYKDEVLSLNARCKHLISSGVINLHPDKETKSSEVISIIKKYYPYVFADGKFARPKVVYRENGTKYLQFIENTNISDNAIVNAYIAYLNSQSMYNKDKVRKQMTVVDFMSVDKKELPQVEFDTLVEDRNNQNLYSFDPTPEAVAKVAKEKADKYAREYAEALEVKKTEKVVYVAE